MLSDMDDESYEPIPFVVTDGHLVLLTLSGRNGFYDAICGNESVPLDFRQEDCQTP